MTDPYAEDTLDKPMDLGFLRRLWPFVLPYRRAFAGCLAILFVSFWLELAGPYLLRLAIDGPLRSDEATDERLFQLWMLGGGFLVVTGLGALLGYVYGQLTAWNGQRVIRDVRRHLFASILHAPASFHDRNPAGKLTTRVTSDVENLNELIATGVLQSLFDLLKIVGVMIAMFFLDLQLALFTLAATPIVIVISVLFRRNAQRAYRKVRGKLALQNAYTTELIGGVRATRAFGREDRTAARYAQYNGETAAAWRDTVLHFSSFFALVDLSLRVTMIGLLWFGASAVLAGEAEPGLFIQFWLYFGLLSGPIKSLGEKYNVLQAAFASTERIFAILDEPRFPPPASAGTKGHTDPPRRGAASIEFREVSFRYLEDVPVLDHISFRAEPGSTIAIVGPTGAGKTSMLSLVSRMRDVNSGSILVDDVDVRDWDVEVLRRRIAVVAQDLFLFTGSILDNVRLFDVSIGEDRVWHSLELVGAADFVRALPGGLAAAVEERGGTFSQGQRQLLAFARALTTDPCVLVLDEATASIDSQTEARLQQALATALQGRTAMVVAHRLSTVRAADNILVLDHGRIQEAGTHTQLVARSGIYAGMLRRLAQVAP